MNVPSPSIAIQKIVFNPKGRKLGINAKLDVMSEKLTLGSVFPSYVSLVTTADNI